MESLDLFLYEDHRNPAPSQEEIDKIEKAYGYPIPDILMELYRHFNGARPKKCYFEAEELGEGSISDFIFVRNKPDMGELFQR